MKTFKIDTAKFVNLLEAGIYKKDKSVFSELRTAISFFRGDLIQEDKDNVIEYFLEVLCTSEGFVKECFEASIK
jgi:hypothetical protein